jgi:hypothetical protein
MAMQNAAAFSDALKVWEADYLACHAELTLLELQALQTLLTQLLERVTRDATGPSSSPVLAPPDAAGA